MKRTLSFMVMALALLLTQCRKPEVKFPTPSSAEGVTVSMTVTAGPGSKTDITAAGAIKWSSGDKLYVGYNGRYVGCLELVSGGSATGTFTGNVTLTDISEDTPQTFHFFYLGSTPPEVSIGANSATVSFASQDIYKNGDKLENAGKHHVGYGAANGTVAGGKVTGINVTMVSKVALARFSFTDGTNPYPGELTLSGAHIYNSMTVNFGGTCTPGTNGNIILADGHAERYVMLVPPTSVSVEDVTFKSGNIEGGATFNNGIEANKFYGQYNAMAVTVKAKPSEANASASAFNGDEWNPKFSVGAGTTVEFAPGNLWYGIAAGKSTPAFHFEANQWDTKPANGLVAAWDASHVSHFYWSNTASVAYAQDYSDDDASEYDKFFTEALDFQVSGETQHTWRTLSFEEWYYLLQERSGASELSALVTLTDKGVSGLVILPDGSDAIASGITSSSALALSGAVFLPAAGFRNGTTVNEYGPLGEYWTCTPSMGVEPTAYYVTLGSAFPSFDGDRSRGRAVRLVRNAS